MSQLLLTLSDAWGGRERERAGEVSLSLYHISPKHHAPAYAPICSKKNSCMADPYGHNYILCVLVRELATVGVTDSTLLVSDNIS